MCRNKILIAAVILALFLTACSTTRHPGERITEPPADAVTSAASIKADTPEARNLPYPGPSLDILVVFRGSSEGTTLERVTSYAETVNEQTIVDKLIEYGVLEEGTEILSFEVSEESDPGAKSSGPMGGGAVTRIGNLDLSKLPETADENEEQILLNCIAGSFMENCSLDGLVLSVNGEPYSNEPLIMDMKYKNISEE